MSAVETRSYTLRLEIRPGDGTREPIPGSFSDWDSVVAAAGALAKTEKAKKTIFATCYTWRGSPFGDPPDFDLLDQMAT